MSKIFDNSVVRLLLNPTWSARERKTGKREKVPIINNHSAPKMINVLLTCMCHVIISYLLGSDAESVFESHRKRRLRSCKGTHRTTSWACEKKRETNRRRVKGMFAVISRVFPNVSSECVQVMRSAHFRGYIRRATSMPGQ